jgi:hypothetical protein
VRWLPLLLLTACGTLHDYRGIIHCHSFLSHDSDGTIEEITAACRIVGVDFVMMTDHPADVPEGEPTTGLHGGVLFFAGAEKQNRLWIEDMVFVAHPEEFKQWDDAALVGMEIYNTHADTKKDPKLLDGLKYDGIRRFLGFWDPPTDFLKKWDAMAQRRRFVGIAGNDAHQNIRIGKVQLDPYEYVFRFVNTHVLAESRDDIVEALRAGHAYVAFEMETPATGFRFAAGDSIMGDEAPVGCRLRVTLPRPAPMRIVRDGEVVAVDRLDFVADRPGVYRVEVDQTIQGRVLPWIYSNPIYVRP